MERGARVYMCLRHKSSSLPVRGGTVLSEIKSKEEEEVLCKYYGFIAVGKLNTSCRQSTRFHKLPLNTTLSAPYMTYM